MVDSKYLSSEAAKAETHAPKMSKSKKTKITQLDNEWIEKNLRDQFLDADGIISPENYNKMKEIQDAIDIADESVSWGEVATNLGSNAIWTAIGLIPGGKIPKIGKYLGKIGKIALPLTGAVMGTVSGAKLLSGKKDITF